MVISLERGETRRAKGTHLILLYICLSFFFFKEHLFIYWLRWVLFAAQAFFSCGEWGLLFVAVRELLIVVASCCGAWALGAWASVVVARELSCPVACGIFPDQGSNPCPLHWQVDS